MNWAGGERPLPFPWERRRAVEERLQKIIANAGLCSRRAAEELLEQGRVSVNGAPAALGQKADPARDRITVDGRPVSRPQLAAEMIAALVRLMADLGGDLTPYLRKYRRDCATLGQEVQLLWRERRERAFAEDLDDQFGLVVRYADGRREVIRSGEVSVRGLYGYVPAEGE